MGRDSLNVLDYYLTQFSMYSIIFDSHDCSSFTDLSVMYAFILLLMGHPLL